MKDEVNYEAEVSKLKHRIKKIEHDKGVLIQKIKQLNKTDEQSDMRIHHGAVNIARTMTIHQLNDAVKILNAAKPLCFISGDSVDRAHRTVIKAIEIKSEVKSNEQ